MVPGSLPKASGVEMTVWRFGGPGGCTLEKKCISLPHFLRLRAVVLVHIRVRSLSASEWPVPFPVVRFQQSLRVPNFSIEI